VRRVPQAGRYQRATDHQSRAIEFYARTGDHIGEIRSLLNLSLVELRQGHYGQAARHAGLAVTGARRAKARGIEGDALVSLGRVELRQAADASQHWQEAARRYAELEAPEAADEEPSGVDLAGLI
jgi:tetratricopeptide (TPR) repeat protein